MRSAFMALLLGIIAVCNISRADDAHNISLSPTPTSDSARLNAIFDCHTGKEVVSPQQVALLTPTQRDHAASGMCSRYTNDNGTFYCKSASCSGSCTFHNIGSYCTCD